MSTTIALCYLVASVLFILGLKGMTKPRTAVWGNLLGSVGMLLAIIATLADMQIVGYFLILLGLLAGTVAGVVLARVIKMEQMPEMVALLNGLGGASSFLVAGADFWRNAILLAVMAKTTQGLLTVSQPTDQLLATALSGIIGAVTLSGSLVAYAKLAELPFLKTLKPLPQQHILTSAVAGMLVMLTWWMIAAESQFAYWVIVAASLLLGYLLTIAIGGADMPVVIALLNSYSGLAAAATGFVLQNTVLIIAGSLVGASGIVLTKIMCDAMNRSLFAVLFGSLRPAEGSSQSGDVYQTVKATSAEEVAMLLDIAQRVMIVPGYGMAVAQAQHAVRDLMTLLQSRGVDVTFAIHPVAGRMPGHMNVLLAEADVPYDLQKDLDQSNAQLEQTDVCVVIGANDTVNPAARETSIGPLAGMPIINADKARTCVVIKRSLSPGFAGVANPLFSAPNSVMLYGDGKQAVVEILAALKGK